METRIIKAVFGASKSIVAPKRFKNDWGQVLELVGITLPQTFTAHFANSKTGTAKKRIGQSNQVDVPDEFFTSGADIYCWVMVHDEATDGRTMYTVRIPVMERPEPINAEPTPVQQDVIAQAITALNDAVEKTAQDVESADTSAQSASDSADRAETARDTAEEYVSTVQNYAQQAQASANSASASATLSASKRNDLAVVDTEGCESLVKSAVNRGVYVYGYLNIGALEDGRSYYQKFKNLRLAYYDGWDGEYWIDVTDKAWQEHILDLAKMIKACGAIGLYLDNTDIYYMCQQGFKEEKTNMF